MSYSILQLLVNLILTENHRDRINGTIKMNLPGNDTDGISTTSGRSRCKVKLAPPPPNFVISFPVIRDSNHYFCFNNKGHPDKFVDKTIR
jgi:hypothetical protein